MFCRRNNSYHPFPLNLLVRKITTLKQSIVPWITNTLCQLSINQSFKLKHHKLLFTILTELFNHKPALDLFVNSLPEVYLSSYSPPTLSYYENDGQNSQPEDLMSEVAVRLLSTSKGFIKFQSIVEKCLFHWVKYASIEYCRIVENYFFLNHDYPVGLYSSIGQKSKNAINSRNISSKVINNKSRHELLPLNLLHSLSCHQEGVKFLKHHQISNLLFQTLNTASTTLEKKSALWSISNICVTNAGCYYVESNYRVVLGRCAFA